MSNENSKVAVVTGGSAGIGRATVRELAAAGYDVAVLARGRAGIEAAAEEVRRAGRRAVAVSVDVADGAAVERAADEVEAALGPIDVWVNCAFCGSLAYFWDTASDEYRRMTDVTYYGQVNGTRAALARMRPRDHGRIVNVSSAMAYRGIPLQSAYCGAKHAVKGFTESIITELLSTGSRVTVGLVTLPGVNTVQFDWNLNRMPKHPMPVPPIYQPEVAARTIRFMAGSRRRNAWVGLPTAYTVLGNRVAPWLADWYLARTGIKSQQSERDAPRYGSNVFTPQDEDADRGAHGPFDDQAHLHDPVSAASRARTAVALAGSGLVAAALTAAKRRR